MYTLPPVPVRTSTAVALGMIALSAVGVATIFGNTIVAVIAPAAPTPSTAATAPAPGGAGPSGKPTSATTPAPTPDDTTRSGPAEPGRVVKDGSS